jgi:hypothetical protein
MVQGAGAVPGHRPPAAPPPSPPRREARNQLKPGPLSASRATGAGSGTPGPLRSATSIRTNPSPVLTATVTVLPGAPEPVCRTLLPKSSLTSSSASSPRGCPGPSTLRRIRGPAAPAPRARQASRSPRPLPRHQLTHPPGRLCPVRSRGPTRRAHRDPRPTRRRTSSQNTLPARPVRARPWKTQRLHRPSYREETRPLYVRGSRNT